MLTRHGYVINKKDLSEDQLIRLRDKLTIKPVQNIMKKKEDDDTYTIYEEGKYRILIPRYYGLREYGEPNIIEMEINNIIDVNIDFIGKLRDMQKKVINRCIPYFFEKNGMIKKYGGGIITVPPGKGKTIMGLFFVYLLNTVDKNKINANMVLKMDKFPDIKNCRIKTLIIVNSTELLRQWADRIKCFMPNVRIGTIRGDKMDIINKDIVIGMLQSICMKNYDESLFESFPFVIFDEAHHLSAKVFSKALSCIQAVYTLGLTATPIRKGDHLEYIYYDYIGPIMHFEEKEKDDNVKVNMINFTPIKTKDTPELNKLFKQIYIYGTGNANFSRMKTNITRISMRNDLIVNIIEQIFPEIPYVNIKTPNFNNIDHNTFNFYNVKDLTLNPFKHYRKLLILTGVCHKVDHFNEIKTRLVNKNPLWEKVIGFYKGKMKPKDLIKSQSKSIIIATYSIAAEGLDIPGLDTAILATPLGDVEQTSGRILRTEKHLRLVNPTIYDIVDNIPALANMAKNRLRDYCDKKYDINWFESTNGSITECTQFIFPSCKNISNNITINNNNDLFIDED